MSASLLIVEDEEPIQILLSYNFEAEGYRVRATAQGEEVARLVNEERPDLIVLDWMLPGISGIEVCRLLRTRPETRDIPIIMLTARGEENERVRGLATGADDYLVKPFSVPELLARVRTILRRANPDAVRGRDIYVDERTVDVHVGRLRKSLQRGRESDPIRTVRSMGYAFDERF